MVCIAQEVAKYIALCGSQMAPYRKPMEVIAQRWANLRPHGREGETG